MLIFKRLLEYYNKNQVTLCDKTYELEVENNNLKTTLEKFTICSKSLNMIIESTRVSFSTNEIGYKESKNEKSYYCVITRRQSRTKFICRKWIPKEYLVNLIGPSVFQVPKLFTTFQSILEKPTMLYFIQYLYVMVDSLIIFV